MFAWLTFLATFVTMITLCVFTLSLGEISGANASAREQFLVKTALRGESD